MTQSPDLVLSDARSVDADKLDGKGKSKKQHGRFSPPCPTCGATETRAIPPLRVEGGAVIRMRLCMGAVPHFFQTKEVAIPVELPEARS
jgi:hypothetical protein